ncbi:cellulose biosynthesis cyclic di-GMP-binding regulatory protein BcsB [Pedobacter agri]|uniref:Cellulose biosynthesis cyclic di-GMP-binding regulatory protein BcsB n=1 Tax=Pedobacter agri TaxID=454586 RepID=A0A9X3DA83_9SPHI|nr:cellulose biosynthesis cyclic di-GMP-binding regulatory protein BcsB [Pedobacter agri]MCX3263617.1 cellulose biosynthesis cyclic di-GMP-binding regulatory protein BcsB [Pedobacter agri]
MKKIILFFIFTILTIFTYAQKPQQSYNFSEQVIRGLEGQYTYYIRVLPIQRLTGSTLSLDVETSKVINFQKSFIHISIDDQPINSVRIDADSLTRLSIVLSKAVSSSGFLKVTIKTQLFIGDDPCQDYTNPGLWLKILPSSSLRWATIDKINLSKVNLSNAIYSKQAIVYPDEISPAELRAVAMSYTKLRKSGVDKIALYSVSQMPDSLSDFIFVGLLHKAGPRLSIKIKADAGKQGGLLYLYKQKEYLPGQIPQQILFVTANNIAGLNKATDALINPAILSSTFQDQLIVEKSVHRDFEKENRLILANLQNSHQLMSGIGSLSHVYEFKTSAFATIPSELNLKMQIKFTAMARDDRGYFNIYLNDVLLSSRQLNESGAIEVNATANRYQIKKFNTLKTEFVFYPASGICSGKFENFVGQVDEERSYVDLSDKLTESQRSFYAYPDCFQSQSTILISNKVFHSSIRAVCELFAHLNDHYSNHLTYLPGIDLTSRAASYKGNNLILISDRTEKLLMTFPQMPLAYQNDFTIYGDSKNEILYKLSSPKGSAISQIFETKDYPVVLSIAIPNDRGSEYLFANAIKDLNEQVNLLAGNTLISNQDSHLVFNLETSNNNIVYEGQGLGRWAIFWQKYKLLALSLILLLVFLGYLYVRSKVKNAQKIISS